MAMLTFVVPSNMILSLVRPSWYLSGCMIAWGLVSGLTAATQGFAGLAVCRFFLGITEVSACLHESRVLLSDVMIFCRPLSLPDARSFSAVGTHARSLVFGYPSFTALPCCPEPLAVSLPLE